VWKVGIVDHVKLMFYFSVKEAGLILLQTIPEHMDINALRADLQKAFPDILNMHDFHVWRLTHSRIFCTVHVVFREPQVKATTLASSRSTFVVMKELPLFLFHWNFGIFHIFSLGSVYRPDCPI